MKPMNTTYIDLIKKLNLAIKRLHFVHAFYFNKSLEKKKKKKVYAINSNLKIYFLKVLFITTTKTWIHDTTCAT